VSPVDTLTAVLASSNGKEDLWLCRVDGIDLAVAFGAVSSMSSRFISVDLDWYRELLMGK
jgi:hypothetical protein